jgi:hypothetical protein
MASLTNEYVNKIDDMSFFQGDTITIPFTFYDGQGDPIDLTRVTIYWRLCPYGKPKSPALILDSVTKGANGIPKIIINESGDKNTCYVNLTVDDTRDLTYYKYTQQPIIELSTENGTVEYIRAEGDVIFKPMIESTDSSQSEDLFRYFN